MNAAKKNQLPDGPLLAWYGDDFTGATAVMEVMSFAGLPSVLFFDIPTREQFQRFAGYRAIGIAGIARSKSPDWMDSNLPNIYRALATVGAPISHYKFCSTLDSSETVGSIGRAADLAVPILGGSWHPLVIGAPEVKRYQAFGNLFAAVDGVAYRLDRHPTMSRHPVTPMSEADVRRHLAKQTGIPIGLVDFIALAAGKGDAALETECTNGNKIIAFDVLDDETLAETGRLIWQNRGERLFTLGSQGVQYALVAHWKREGLIEEFEAPLPPRAVNRIAVVSGSCSPVTAQQIEVAEYSGFAGIPVDIVQAVDSEAWEAEIQRATNKALAIMGSGHDPILYTARGPDDPSTARFRTAVETSGIAIDKANENVGSGLGRILGQVVRQGGLKRGVIAGGDTSSHGALTMGIYALTAKAATAPGAALCEAHSDDPALSDFELALKGGQMGGADYFLKVKRGANAAQ